jgi:hypothetical protein
MEKRIELAPDKAGEVRPLRPVAFGTGQAQVVGVVPAAVLLRDDVFDVERQEIRVVLVKAAVFSAAVRPPPDESAASIIHPPRRRAAGGPWT